MSRVRSTASFERVEEKQEEMSFFFLERLAEADDNPFVFRCYFSAFASAAMSVLYALDSARKMIDPDFAAWYEPRRLKLVEEDPTTSYVLARRGEAVHIGETRIRSGSMHLGDNGEPIYKHFFSLHLGRPEPVAVDVLSACEHTHHAICSLVGETPEAFPRVCPDYFMDADTLKREGWPSRTSRRVWAYPGAGPSSRGIPINSAWTPCEQPWSRRWRSRSLRFTQQR